MAHIDETVAARGLAVNHGGRRCFADMNRSACGGVDGNGFMHGGVVGCGQVENAVAAVRGLCIDAATKQDDGGNQWARFFHIRAA